jgi:hypothetical protein
MQQDNEDPTKQLKALPSPHAVLVYYHKRYFCINSCNTDLLAVSLHKLKPQSEQPMHQRIIQAKCLLKISLTDAYFITDNPFFFNFLINFDFTGSILSFCGGGMHCNVHKEQVTTSYMPGLAFVTSLNPELICHNFPHSFPTNTGVVL